MLIAALGSSFAAGPGIEPIVDAAASRSGRNYPHRLAERLGAELVDLTVSGATTANVLDTPQQTDDETVFAPQLDGVPADADVITVTAGGNDLQFAGAMTALATSRVATDPAVAAQAAAMFPNGVPRPPADVVEAAAAGLVRIVERARAIAPGARLLLVDYLTVLDRGSLPATPFTAAELDGLLDLQTAVATVFERAAERSGAELVRASVVGRGHALGAAEPWVFPFGLDADGTGGSFHPNAAGMSAIADEIARVVG